MTTLCICDIAGLLGEKLPDWAASLPARPERPEHPSTESERAQERNASLARKSAPARCATEFAPEYEPVPI